MSHPRVTSAIVGPGRQTEHLKLAREALAIELDQDTQREIGEWFDFSGIE